MTDIKMIGWTKWEGGECPVDDGVLVRVRYESGLEEVGEAKEFDWKSLLVDYTVIAYQVLQVGTCQNGDPIIIGGVYEVGDYTVHVLNLPRTEDGIACFQIGGVFEVCEEIRFKCLHQPKEEPLQRVRWALEQFRDAGALYDESMSEWCGYFGEKKAKEALKELDEYMEGK